MPLNENIRNFKIVNLRAFAIITVVLDTVSSCIVPDGILWFQI